ncbi:MAG TPA: AmmeMemoRadiSam system protein B [Candidatus Deferrimicrobiaceae bacterium]|nr:AmmeMemoRadiSam system protein B [Candidatus Deferrimicrobiaceae bacterium]
METLPPLRTDIELVPARAGGREVIAISDPLEIVPEGAALASEAVIYLPLFDGTATVSDLQMEMMRRGGGGLVYRSEAERFALELDRLGILQTSAYRAAREQIVEKFAEQPERPAVLAGKSYPEDPAVLSDWLDRIIAGPEDRTPADPSRGAPCGLAAPHIDLRVAERTYGHAYRAIRAIAPSAVLLLGTGHALGGVRYCLTDKIFTTPLGRVPTDREAVARIRTSASQALCADDFPHRREHSIEFQLLFLQRIFPMEETPVVPVLCGGMEDLFGRVGSPAEDPGVAAFTGALSAWLDTPPAPKIVVAGIDLSHVGPKFGDPESGRALEPEVRSGDGVLLEAFARGDADALFAAAASGRNRYRVCGLSALWTLLAILPGTEGTVLDYGIHHEEPTRSAVSFCAAVLHRR